jgi:hypothetical protein
MVKKWLGIMPATGNAFTIKDTLTYAQNYMRNRLWYIGEPELLQQFYKNVDGEVNGARFWSAVPPSDLYVRKIHTGLPAAIIDKLSAICGDIIDCTASDEGADGNGNVPASRPKTERWAKIAEANGFDRLLIDTVLPLVLSCGEGAFRIVADTTLSDVPAIRFFPGDRVEYKRDALGNITDIAFLTAYKDEKSKKEYILRESYGRGYIRYELRDEYDKPVSLNVLPETAELRDVTFPVKEIFAVPFVIGDNKRYEGRGESLFEKKGDCFDALDEIVSQWLDAVRAGRTRTYIPESLVPEGKRPSQFHNWFKVAQSFESENAKNGILTENGAIPSNEYLTAYVSKLDECLTGIISPSTLGIDVKKLDNAEAQREKEKTTLYTRQRVTGILAGVLKKLIRVALIADDVKEAMKAALKGLPPPVKDEREARYGFDINFNEYANPSFEANIEALSKAAPGQRLISLEWLVNELWGNTKSEEEKRKEVERLRAANMPQAVNGLLPSFDFGGEGGGYGDGSGDARANGGNA